MRWTIEGFSQKRLVGLGLDAIDAVLLRFVADFYLSGKMQKVIMGDQEYFWLCYSHVLSELPILGIEKRQLSNRMDKLVEAGVMKKEVVRSGIGTRAYIRFDEEIFAALVSDNEFITKEKSLKPEIDVMEKLERRELKDMFFRYYEAKAKELRGTAVKPLWGAKEASLLKADSDQLGVPDTIRCMKLFFSDHVQEVKEFTRTKNKAGYSYAVFHGMLQRLSIAHGNMEGEPCTECGGWQHLPGCSSRTVIQSCRDKEMEEALEARGELAEMDIAGMFDTAVKKARE